MFLDLKIQQLVMIGDNVPVNVMWKETNVIIAALDILVSHQLALLNVMV